MYCWINYWFNRERLKFIRVYMKWKVKVYFIPMHFYLISKSIFPLWNFFHLFYYHHIIIITISLFFNTFSVGINFSFYFFHYIFLFILLLSLYIYFSDGLSWKESKNRNLFLFNSFHWLYMLWSLILILRELCMNFSVHMRNSWKIEVVFL